MSLSFFLYLLMAVASAASAFLGTDEAAKYIEPERLFWARGIVAMIDGVALTMKGYTSPGFQDWLKKKATGNTEFIRNQTGP